VSSRVVVMMTSLLWLLLTAQAAWAALVVPATLHRVSSPHGMSQQSAVPQLMASSALPRSCGTLMQAEEEPRAWQSQDELGRVTHWQQRARKACVRARCALGKAARVALVSALLILPARGGFGGLAAHAATTTATVDEMVDTPEDAEEQAAMASELVQRSNDGQPLVIKVVKVGGTVGVAGAGIAYALKSKAEADAAKKREADEYLQQLMASEAKTVGLPSFLDELTPDAPSALQTTPGSLQAAAAAAPVAAPTPSVVAPPVAPAKPAEEPKRLGLNLFKKQAVRHVPTVDELTAAGTPQAALCKTIAWALRAPIDIATVGLESASAETIDEDGPMALALSILEELEVARNASLAAVLTRCSLRNSSNQNV